MSNAPFATEPPPPGMAQLFCWYYQGNLCYPMPVERIMLLRQAVLSPSIGSSLVAELLQNRLVWPAGIDSSTIVAFSVEHETGTDDWEPRRIWMYSAKGEYLGEDAGPLRFFGRPQETLRFKCGHVVSYLTGATSFELRLGIVRAVPLSPERVAEITAEPSVAHPDDTDDTYAVYSLDGEDFTHDHLPECYLSEPTGLIDQTLRDRLLDLLQTTEA